MINDSGSLRDVVMAPADLATRRVTEGLSVQRCAAELTQSQKRGRRKTPSPIVSWRSRGARRNPPAPGPPHPRIHAWRSTLRPSLNWPMVLICPCVHIWRCMRGCDVSSNASSVGAVSTPSPARRERAWAVSAARRGSLARSCCAVLMPRPLVAARTVTAQLPRNAAGARVRKWGRPRPPCRRGNMAWAQAASLSGRPRIVWTKTRLASSR